MSVPTGGSWWSHANNKAVMLLKCSGARLKCRRFFFLSPLSVHMLTVDHLMAHLIAVAPSSLSIIVNLCWGGSVFLTSLLPQTFFFPFLTAFVVDNIHTLDDSGVEMVKSYLGRGSKTVLTWHVMKECRIKKWFNIPRAGLFLLRCDLKPRQKSSFPNSIGFVYMSHPYFLVYSDWCRLNISV